MNEATTIIQVGFSVFVAVYLLKFTTTTVKAFTEAIQQLTEEVHLLREFLGEKTK
ncbi:MAG: hypothetical protein J0M18_18500 [Ignavibacteria bacterium]|nr:hypothetical protein [Ignavibacteria bacterium]